MEEVRRGREKGPDERYEILLTVLPGEILLLVTGRLVLSLTVTENGFSTVLIQYFVAESPSLKRRGATLDVDDSSIVRTVLGS